ncbi:gamma-glutamyl-gamma-aminobutyrate hydrolase family protein [Octadecabacter ascidiaceicola]|uniref:Gamma-glutamyl-gamma-aminobutyrate hydrolase PuuD n=1 Tax=Octadecabacter ascidiaceicola TaxID=1655543 RepID=A0A238K6D2_9RHOB|nr:gamma-glutamyl-gamma-aminobutyrate hydrolase family protein [Octadecabacter ascidiaceicola]SMX38027.1 Gamma-glutamyl-gamma-aminobutyrate hydrolase PuuD [Octadecabacter ascidiaceicola]
MRKPVIGIIGNHDILHGDYPAYTSGAMNAVAVSQVAGGLPLVVPAHPDLVDVDHLSDVCDGFLFTGGRPNVHPDEYGHEETEAHGAFDRERDAIALPLIRKCVERGQPILGICRGFQEVAVAMGCTLHPEIRDIPGRDNHRMPPDGSLEEKFGMRHLVTVSEGGPYHRLWSKREVMTNSLHGQGILECSQRIVIDGRAPDTTPEAIYVKDAIGFTLAVQWHPEWQAGLDPVSKPLFEAFGVAAGAWANRGEPSLLQTA